MAAMWLLFILSITSLSILNYINFAKYKNSICQIRRIINQAEGRRNGRHHFPISVTLGDKHIEEVGELINGLLEEKKHLNQKLNSVRTDLQTQMASLSHDLRTPLTAIKGYAQLIGSDQTNIYYQAMLRRIDDLDDMTRKFYSLVKLEQDDDQGFKRETLDFKETLKQHIRIWINKFEQKQLEMRGDLDLEGSLNLIEVDGTYLNRILDNLFSNAYKYGKTYIHLLLDIGQSNGSSKQCMRFSISNDCDHLESIDKALLGNRFYTPDSSRNNGGTGLGLYTTRLMLEKIGGQMTYGIETRTHEYRVTIILPLSPLND